LRWSAACTRPAVVDPAGRMHDDIAPGWPQPHISIQPRDLGYGGASGQGVYRVEIEGSPAMRCEFEMADDHDHDLGARRRPGWSMPFRRSAPRNPVSCRRWTC